MKKLKAENETGLDGMKTEHLKIRGNAYSKWLTRMFNVCLDGRRVPLDWRVTCIVTLYKGK